MAGGIDISPTAGAAIAGQISVAIVRGTTSSAQVAPATATGPWRPPQWNKVSRYMLITQPATSGSNNIGQSPSSVPTSTVPTLSVSAQSTQAKTYVFDAIMRARHGQRLQITEHPIQTGANISDHAYLLPAQLSLEVGISDAMDMYAPGMWAGNTSKSVSAYQTLLNLQAARTFVTVVTRLRTYTNMMIEDISPEEDQKTFASLRCTITFKQVFTASVAVQAISARPNTTDSTQLATVQAQPVPASVTNQYAVTPPANPTVQGAGTWTSISQGITPVEQ